MLFCSHVGITDIYSSGPLCFFVSFCLSIITYICIVENELTQGEGLVQVKSISSRIHAYIILTPLNPTFILVKLGFVGVYIIFLILLKNIDSGYSLEPPR